MNTGCAEGEGAATHSAEAEGKAPPLFSMPTPSLRALNNTNVGLFSPSFVAARTSSAAGDMLEGGSPPPFIDSNNDSAPIALDNLLPPDSSRCSSSASYEESDSDYHNDEDGDLKPAAANEESDSDYDNDEDWDLKPAAAKTDELKTGGDFLAEPTAKTKKTVPGGPFSPRRESLGIIQDFISKQVSLLFAQRAEQVASSPTGENNDFVEEEGGGQYDDDELFQDDVKKEDMTYYHSTTKGKCGRPLLMDGGPPRPDTKDMTAVGAAMAINDWRVGRKAFRDKQNRLLRKSMGSTASGLVFTGVLNEKLWTMTEVGDTPLKVDDTFPLKEILLIRTVEEANFSGCSTSTKRSDDH